MRKCLLVIGLSVVGMLGIQGSATAQESESERRDWACIAIHDLDEGVCQRNPLPERLPVPDETTAPEAPAVTVPDAPAVTVPDASGVTVPSAPSGL